MKDVDRDFGCIEIECDTCGDKKEYDITDYSLANECYREDGGVVVKEDGEWFDFCCQACYQEHLFEQNAALESAEPHESQAEQELELEPADKEKLVSESEHLELEHLEVPSVEVLQESITRQQEHLREIRALVDAIKAYESVIRNLKERVKTNQKLLESKQEELNTLILRGVRGQLQLTFLQNAVEPGKPSSTFLAEAEAPSSLANN